MMNGAIPTRTPRHLRAGLMVYLTAADRQQLREALKAEGIYSASSWFRQMAMQKLKQAVPQAREGHADVDAQA